MTRRLMLLCATLVALATESAYGVGLGELELNSALNQKFDAEIKLTNVGNLESDEILPNLASQKDFERVGVERSYALTDLRFKIATDDRGDPVIKVTSTEPVVEPYLNFIVEVLWPSGRLLREYTVLLDPPVFGEHGVEPIRIGETVRPSRQQAEQAPRRAEPESSRPPQTRERRMEDQGQLSGNEYGMTGPGDTLWAIALKVRPNDSVSVQQTMLALQRVNPDAFINGNINLLKAGHVLRVPDLAEIRSQGREEAIGSVQRHNDQFEAWRESGGNLAQLDASRRQQSGASGATQDPGELRLLASEQQSQAGSGAGGSSERQVELEAELAMTKEDLDRANRANAEMDRQIADLESQIEDLSALIEAKDNQLATLQDQLRKQMEQAETAAPTPPPAQDDALSALLMNPFVLGGLGILLIGGLAGGMIYSRKRRQSTALEEDEFDDLALDEDTTEVSTTSGEDETGEVEAEEIDEELAPQTSDAISEAEIYIAYGRFPQAITFLQNAIEAEPDRTDLQLKLLEVYVQTEDATAFNLQYEKLKELGDEDAIARAAELQRKIPGASETAEAAMDATVVSSGPVAAVSEPDDDSDDDFSFDLDDLDSETDDDELDLGSDADDTSDELELDLDLEEDTASSDETALTGSSDADDDDAFDLDLDDDLELDLDDASTEDSSEDDTEFSLDEADSEFSLDEADSEFSLDEDAVTETETDDTEFSLDDDEFNLDDDEFNLDDDDTELNLDDDEFSLDDDNTELNLDDDEISLDDDDELDLGDDSTVEEDAGTKLDLARAYIDMGDNEGARSVLQQVVKEGSDSEIKQANELLENID